MQKTSCCCHFRIVMKKNLLTSLNLVIYSCLLIKPRCKRLKKRCQLREYLSWMKQRKLLWCPDNQKKFQDLLKSLPQDLSKEHHNRKNGSNLSLSRSYRSSSPIPIATANQVQKSTNLSLSTTATCPLRTLSNVFVTLAKIWFSSWRIEVDRWNTWRKN